MAEETETVQRKVGRCMLHNWVEERAVATLNLPETRSQILKRGHIGILGMNRESEMESVNTLQATFDPPEGAEVRLRGIRRELLEKKIAAMMREKIEANLNLPSPKTDYRSTTHRHFAAKGFVPQTPETTQVHDYTTDQAFTFWSDNYERIQGMTGVQNLKAPFRRSGLFSTLISKRLDEIELPPDN